MKNLKLFTILAGLVAFAFTGSAYAQDARPQLPSGPRLPKVDVSKLPTDLQALVSQFRDQKKSLHELSAALREQLKNATREERKALLDQFAADNADAIAAQKDLAKQIRQELRALREQRREARPTTTT